MSDKVVSISGGAVPTREPNATCIAALTEWLEMARAGEIVGVVMAALHHDGLGSFAICGTVGGYSMIGALEIAKADLVEINRDG